VHEIDAMRLFVGVQPLGKGWRVQVSYGDFAMEVKEDKLDAALDETLKKLMSQVSRRLEESTRIIATLGDESSMAQPALTIVDLIERTTKPGESVFKLSDEVALRLYDKAGWCVMEVMTLTKHLTSTQGGHGVDGVLVEAPLGEPALNALVSMMQAMRMRR
jgi:hypothetical protein